MGHVTVTRSIRRRPTEGDPRESEMVRFVVEARNPASAAKHADAEKFRIEQERGFHTHDDAPNVGIDSRPPRRKGGR